MNILNINLPKSHFHTLIGLVESGHTVYTNYHDSRYYEPSLGIKYITEEENNSLHFDEYKLAPGEPCETLKEKRKEQVVSLIDSLITKYNIDILHVGHPELAYLNSRFKNKVKYIGPTEEAALLEINKIYSKALAETLGLKVPKILKHGKYHDKDYGENLSFPCIEKPSNTWNPASILYSEEDKKRAIELLEIGQPPRHQNLDYYIEEYIDDMIETNVFFIIANGKYVITHTQEIIGENLNKTVQSNVWYFGSYIKPLKPEVDKIVRREAHKYLKHIAKLGGSWEGSFCGAYTSKGDWYFLETNVRPDIFNSTPTFVTGDEYLKGLFEDISIFENAWKDKKIEKLLITTESSENEYPLYLHDKYNVSYPNNLELKDGKYYVCLFGIIRHDNEKTGCGTVISDHNIPIEFKNEVEQTTPWSFNGDPS